MSYEMFFEAVKTLLWKSLNDIPEYKLVEYMKSQEDVIKSQYNYWAEQVEINNETVTEESLPGFASGAAYSLYLLYEGQASFLIKEVQLYVLIWEEKMVLQYMVVFICFVFLQDIAALYILQMV